MTQLTPQDPRYLGGEAAVLVWQEQLATINGHAATGTTEHREFLLEERT